MKIKTINNYMIASFLILGVFTLISAAIAVHYRNAQIHMMNLQHESLILANQLAAGSDRLTNDVRAFVATGDAEYDDDYKKEVNVEHSRDKAVENLRKLGTPEKELNFIEEAKRNSDSLIDLENRAFEAGRNGNLELARKLVYGKDYKNAKAKIMLPIFQFNQEMEQRLTHEVTQASERAGISISVMLVMLILNMVAILAAVLFYYQRKVISPLIDLTDNTQKFLNGNRHVTFGYKNDESEIGELARTLEGYRLASNETENQRSMKQTLSEIDQALLGAKNYEEFGSILSSKLAPSLELIYCALYIADEKSGNLKREGGYGCDSKHTTHFHLGEGLVGQVAKDRESIALSVPLGDSLVGVVTSGAGVFAMRNMLILPILQNEKMLGVFEVGSTEVIDNLKTEFLHTLMPMIAAKIQILAGVVETAELLHESLVQADIMAEQAARLEEQTVESEMHQVESKNTEFWLRGVVEATPEAILVVNSKNKIVLCNSKAEKILGYESGELDSKNIDEVAHEAMRGNADNLLAVRKDGSQIQIACSLNSVPDLGGRGVCTYATIREIVAANEDTKVALQSV